MSDKKPLVAHIYTADPSAHVFDGTLYVYPSHDIPTDIQDNDNGDQYAMEGYHVFSLPSGHAPSPINPLLDAPDVVDDGSVLHMRDVPGAKRDQWWTEEACHRRV